MQQSDRPASLWQCNPGQQDNAPGELDRALEQLSLVLSVTGVGVWERDLASNRVTWSDTMHRLFGVGREQLSGSPDEVLDCVHPDDRAAFRGAYESAVRGDGDSFSQEFRILRSDGEVRWVYRRGQVRRASDGHAISIIGVAIDVTERKEREARIRLLMQEVLHRSKNLLTIVQAIASQSAHSTGSPAAFAEDFGARLASLAASLDLLVRKDWRGVSVRELVQSQLRQYCGPQALRVELAGSELVLCPVATQYLGMALHELATNAEKHGALADPAGRVRVEWDLEGQAGERRFRISWTESGAASVKPPAIKRFGHLVIERLAAEALQASSILEFTRDGLRWTLEADAQAAIQSGRD
jgi:PAS domain S-box-containing protein